MKSLRSLDDRLDCTRTNIYDKLKLMSGIYEPKPFGWELDLRLWNLARAVYTNECDSLRGLLNLSSDSLDKIFGRLNNTKLRYLICPA